MNLDHIVAVLQSPDKTTIDRLLEDRSTAFWIDWRQEDETIADACELVLETGKLVSELVEVDTDEGYEVYVQYFDRRRKVPLSYSESDRHITLVALNQVLAPDYEIRFCIDSHGSDTLAFLPLSTEQWSDLERRFGEAVGRRFFKLTERPNVFTDVLNF
jgi:hypothetical protein